MNDLASNNGGKRNKGQTWLQLAVSREISRALLIVTLPQLAQGPSRLLYRDHFALVNVLSLIARNTPQDIC